jgi:copper oxidase (laccase) domain-containing protein
MVGLGAEPARIAAVVGPAICGRCYEVPEKMRRDVNDRVPGTACDTAVGTPALDLVAGALGVLDRLGVTARAVGICTAEDRRFYSYRRDGVTGRFAGVAMISG